MHAAAEAEREMNIRLVSTVRTSQYMLATAGLPCNMRVRASSAQAAYSSRVWPCGWCPDARAGHMRVSALLAGPGEQHWAHYFLTDTQVLGPAEWPKLPAGTPH